MRPLLKYGVPAAAGLATGGYALSQGEDPGSAALAGIGGTLGGAAGLLGARKLAGKYAGHVAPFIDKNVLVPAGNALGNYARQLPASAVGGNRMSAINAVAGGLEAADRRLNSPGAARAMGKVAAGISLPGGAALAGLGGIAAGGGLQAMGVPGFQQNQYMDPESYGSSNSAGARTKATTISYPYSSYA